MLLNKEPTDTDLAFLVQNQNDQNALSELISRHYVDMLKKFGYKSLSDNQIHDIMKDKDYVIYKAACDYNPEKAKFSTHLANRTKYLCLTQKTKNKTKNRELSFEETEFFQKDKNKTPSENCAFNDSFSRILKLIEKHKDPRLKTIFKERYFKGKRGKLKPWKLVAEKVNLSAQGCINIHDKAIKEFKNKIDNEKIKL